MGAAGSTVYYNLRLRHPTLEMPLIDYDLALLFQPMLMLGISIGVAFNVMFADWMVTILLIILFIGNIICPLLFLENVYLCCDTTSFSYIHLYCVVHFNLSHTYNHYFTYSTAPYMCNKHTHTPTCARGGAPVGERAI